jgi:hypothetical protein
VAGVDRRLLRIYLGDHLAGATGGLELARRCLSSNRGTELGQYLEAKLVPEILEDRQTLIDVMARLGISEQPWRTAVGWVTEKVARFKLNGYVLSYSPLSRLVELEALTLGIRGKLSLWETLGEVAPAVLPLAGVDLPALARRARLQLEDLQRHRLAAARQAFLPSFA